MTETMQGSGPVTYDEAVALVRCALAATGPIRDEAPALYLAQVKALALGLRGVAAGVSAEASSVLRSFSGTGTLLAVIERYRTSAGKLTDLGRVVIEPDHGRHEREEIWIDLRAPSGASLVAIAKDLVGAAVRYRRESRVEMRSDGPRINPETKRPQSRPYLVSIEAVGGPGAVGPTRPTYKTRQAATKRGETTVPRTTGELLSFSAQRFGLERGEVARLMVSTCGELRGPMRTPLELALAWEAIIAAYEKGASRYECGSI